MAYGKSLLSRGEAGAAIFIFEPLVHAGDASLELRDLYAQALLSRPGAVWTSEPLDLADVRAEPGAHAPGGEPDRKDDRFRTGCGGGGAGAETGSISAAAWRTTILHHDHAGTAGLAPSVGGNAGVSGGTVQRLEPRNRLRAGAAEAFRSVLHETRLPESRRVSGPGGGSGSLRAGPSKAAGSAARQDRRSAFQCDRIALLDGEERRADQSRSKNQRWERPRCRT